LSRSDLNNFLFADVGVESSGMTLSVLSVLARLGMDPWQEAARLAQMPRTAAVEGLARIIAAMPSSLWSLPDATAIAARLVALLPSRGGPSVVPLARTALATRQTIVQLAVVMGLLAAVGVGLALHLTGYWTSSPVSDIAGSASSLATPIIGQSPAGK
jgi:hypothetical protein